jgi:hypothetical protein
MLFALVTHGLYQVFVTVYAPVQHNLVIKRPDENWIGDNIECECDHILDAIDTLHGILLNYVVGSMAIHAQCYIFVAGAVPALIGSPHHVAVGASFGIATQIGKTFGIDKSESPQTDNGTRHTHQQVPVSRKVWFSPAILFHIDLLVP